MDLTPDPHVNRLLDTLLAADQRAFGDNLVAVYLYGSLTTGDFEPGSSDIDLLVALSSPISAPEFRALSAIHRQLARENPDWDGRIEAVYMPAEGLRNFRSQRSAIAWIAPGEPLHQRDAGAEWLMNWYEVRENGVALFGPPPKKLIAPISREEFAECVRYYVQKIAGRIAHAPDRRDQAYDILTMCRALHLHRTGKQASKRRAAEWAQRELPEWSALIRDALAWRDAWRESTDPGATRGEAVAFVMFVSDRILVSR